MEVEEPDGRRRLRPEGYGGDVGRVLIPKDRGSSLI